MSEAHHGGCLCGGVRYEYVGAFADFIYCHCQDCRKSSGSAFNANASIEVAGFTLLRGHELLKSYSASPGKQRIFCGVCGSPLYSRKDWEPLALGLRMGTLDSPTQALPEAHQFVSSKATWDVLHGDVPRHPHRISASPLSPPSIAHIQSSEISCS